MQNDILLVLHNIRSAQNTGAIFRTADAFAVAKVFLTGYTPTPIDRFGRSRNDIAKTALGAEKTLLWEYAEDCVQLLAILKKERRMLVALEQAESAISLREFSPAFPLALIVGNETEGLSNEVLAQCERIVEIPMHGEKESLNVSVALGITLFALRDQ